MVYNIHRFEHIENEYLESKKAVEALSDKDDIKKRLKTSYRYLLMLRKYADQIDARDDDNRALLQGRKSALKRLIEK